MCYVVCCYEWEIKFILVSVIWVVVSWFSGVVVGV